MRNWLEIKTLGIQDILRIMPHRFPFLLIDRVLEIKTGMPLTMGMAEEDIAHARKGSRVHAIKNVTINEIQFQGHFPENPILPGVLTLEAMAQAAAFATIPFVALRNGGKLPPLRVALAGFDGVRFRKPIVPGDTMHIKTEVKHAKGSVWSFDGLVEVDGKKVAEGTFLAQLGVGEAE